MNSLNSDQLRKKLHLNTVAMNALAGFNDEIVGLLKQRGLQAVDADQDNTVEELQLTDTLGEILPIDFADMLNHAPVENKSRDYPLTLDELKAGGWWCADVSADCESTFADKGIRVFAEGWDNKHRDYNACRVFGLDPVVYRSFRGPLELIEKGEQIHRIGNNFYWGAPK